MRTTGCILAAGLIAGVSAIAVHGQVAPAARATRGPGWHTNFDQALAEARQLNRPLFVHFYSEWCPPCRRMDRDVLRQPDVKTRLSRRFVVVRIDADIHPELVSRFDVRGLPSDVVITPDGHVLDAAEGYRERPAFLAALDQATIRFDLAMGRPDVQTQPVSIGYADDPDTPAGRQPPAVVSGGSEGGQNSRPSGTPAGPRQILVGLDGYSPVSLWNAREWKKGRRDFAVEHQGVTYFLATPEEADEFRTSPGRFAPQLLGCDPVVLFETDRALPGSTRFGAYYEGQLFLFVGVETRSRFKEKPTRYTQTQHVLHADDLDASVLR